MRSDLAELWTRRGTREVIARGSENAHQLIDCDLNNLIPFKTLCLAQVCGLPKYKLVQAASSLHLLATRSTNRDRLKAIKGL
jgi:hypothetical protein